MSVYEIKGVLKYRGGRPGDPWGDDGEAKARAMPMTQAGMNETRLSIYAQGSQQRPKLLARNASQLAIVYLNMNGCPGGAVIRLPRT